MEGQEVTMTPNQEYLDAAEEAQEWIAATYPDEVKNAKDYHH